MVKFLVKTLSLLIAASVLNACDSGCKSDSDCKGSRICQNSLCIEASAIGPSLPDLTTMTYDAGLRIQGSGGSPCGASTGTGECGTVQLAETIKRSDCASGFAIVNGIGGQQGCPPGQQKYFAVCGCEPPSYNCKDQVWGEGVCPGEICATVQCRGSVTSCGGHKFYCPGTYWLDGSTESSAFCCSINSINTLQFVPCPKGKIPCFETGTCVNPNEKCSSAGISCIEINC